MTERLKIIGEIVLNERGCFTVAKIARETGISTADVRTVLDRLFREGLLLRIKIDPQFAPAAGLRGRPPAKLLYQKKSKRQFAGRIAPKLKEDTAQDRMWKVIRYLRDFTMRDLIRTAEVKRENARSFVKALRRAGIVRNVGYRDWVLIKDVGPRRPYVGDQKHQ
jgi:predicted ArsR family transcriptional regulator